MSNIIMLKSTTYFQINHSDWMSEGQRICLETDEKSLHNVLLLSIFSENYSICVTDDITHHLIALRDITSINHTPVLPNSLIFFKEEDSFSLDQKNYYKEGSFITVIDRDGILYERVKILSLCENPLSITFVSNLELITLELENIKTIHKAFLDECTTISYDKQ